MPDGQTFTDVQPIAQTFGDVQPISAPDQGQLKAEPKSTGMMDSISRWTENVSNDIKYGTDTTGIGTVLKKMGAHGVYNGNSQAVGDFMASLPLGLLKATKGQAEIQQPGKVWQGTKNLVSGLSDAATIPMAMDAGATVENAADLAEGVTSLAKRAVTAPFKAAKATEAGRAITQTLAPDVENAAISTTRGGATFGGAATSITNKEVLQHAAEEGIHLTPAQALQTSAAKSEQTLGEEALLTGSKIRESIAKSKAKLADAVDSFQDRIDPQRVGLSAEAAGEHLQESANVAKSVLKDNVDHIYSQVRDQQADLAGDVQTPLRNFLQSETMVRQPHAAATRPVFKTAAAQAAINDINGMLDSPALKGQASVESLRNLRTTLLEKGNDYSANALADSGQRIYKLAAGKVDDAIMDAARGTPFEDTFREAGRQNAKLQQLYNDKRSPLYRILNTEDPAAVTDGILNRSSVHEIEQLKSENFDLGPLARQAVEDIKSGGFRVTPNGLGGYPDTFLRSLLGPESTKELYLKSDIARRLAENYNPSGSGKVVLGASQALHPVAAVAAQAARARSMPQAAINYLSQLPKP